MISSKYTSEYHVSSKRWGLGGKLLIGIPVTLGLRAVTRALFHVLPPGAIPVCSALSFFLLAVMWMLILRREVRFLRRYLGKGMPVPHALCLTIGMTLALLAINKPLLWAWLNSYSEEPPCGAYSLLGFSGLGISGIVFLAADTLEGCLFGPIVEELIFRVGVFTLVLRRLGSWPAVLISGVIFGAIHMLTPISVGPGLRAVCALRASLVGLGAGVLLLRTRRVFWCIMLHSLVNLGSAISPNWLDVVQKVRGLN